MSLVVVSALLGTILGSAASLYVQRSPVQQATTCPVCPVCGTAVEARSAGTGGALAAQLGVLPVGGTWTPAGRESMGNAELQKVLASIAVNNEVLVAGTPQRQKAAPHLTGCFSVQLGAYHGGWRFRHAGDLG